MADNQDTTLQCLECGKFYDSSLDKCPDDQSALVPAKQDKLLGAEFAGRYRIEEIAGKGGMSTVYKARHKYIERYVALKLMHHHLVGDSTSIKRFQHEAKAASSLIHPNVINVYDFGISDDGDAYIVMDYLEGCSLSDMINQGGAVPEYEAIEIIRQTCKGLLHAHKKGVVHRDIKPANLVLTVDEDESVLVKLVDFGIAKVKTEDDSPSQHLTRTGEVFGSPLYMSPEQWQGMKIDARSDIYSLGCLIYELLAGWPPFAGDTPLDSMTMHLNDKPLTFKEFNENLKVSEQMEALVFKCLEKKLDKRYQSVLEIIQDLPEALEPEVDQGKTVPVRLIDILDASVEVEKPVVTKTTLAKKKKFRVSYEKRAKYFGVAFALLFGFICLYQGPDEDPGPPASKMIWQLELSLSHVLMNCKFYGVAIPILEFSNWHAANLDPILGRPNYEKRSETMFRLARCYKGAGKSSQYEKLIQEYTNLDKEKWKNYAEIELTEIVKAENYIAELRKNRESIQSHLSESVLNKAASVQKIVEIARRLEANNLFELEYQLLYKTEKLIKELYGPNFIGLADLKLQRISCLKNQDRIAAIDPSAYVDKNDPRYEADTKYGLFGSILKIREFDAKKRLGVDPDEDLTLDQLSKEPELIRSILYLGQWQRRINDYDQAEKNLSLSVKAAEKNDKFKPDELAEFYTSYANLLHQMNKSDLSNQYLEKAKEQRQLIAKEMGFKYIDDHSVD